MNAPLRIPLDMRDEETGDSVAELCFSQLRWFQRFFWPLIPGAGKPVWSWHYDYTADLVQLGLERNWGTYVFAEPIGTGKSIRYGVLSPCWDWLHRPWTQWMTVSSTFRGVATRDSRRMRLLLNTPEYQALAALAGVAGDVKLSRDQNEKTNFANVAGGARHCYGMDSGITGGDAHRILGDDLLEAEVVHWPARRLLAREESVWTKWTDSVEDRARARADDDGDHDPVPRFMTAQKLTHGDPIGRYIKERDKALRDKGESDITITVIPERYDPNPEGGLCPADPRTGTYPGPLLFPAWHSRTAKINKRLSRPGGQKFVQSRHDQRAVAEDGGMFHRRFYDRRYSHHPHAMARSCATLALVADCGGEDGDHNDPTCIWLVGRIGSYRHVLWCWSERRLITDQPGFLRRVARELAEVWGLASVEVPWMEHWDGPPKGGMRTMRIANIPWFVEDDSKNGSAMLRLKPVPKMIAFSPTGKKGAFGIKASKAARANDFSLASKAGEWLFPLDEHAPWAKDSIDEIHGFGVGAPHDENVDCGAMGEYYFTYVEPPKSGRRLAVGY